MLGTGGGIELNGASFLTFSSQSNKGVETWTPEQEEQKSTVQDEYEEWDLTK